MAKAKTAQEKLKELDAKKKQIAAEQKKLREEFNKGREQRIATSKAKTKAQNEARANRAKIRELSASVDKTFKAGDGKAIIEMSEDLLVHAENLSANILDYAKAVSPELFEEVDEEDALYNP